MSTTLATRLALAELRSSQRTFAALFMAITIGIAALTAINSFAERIEQAMAERSGELLGGDLRVTSQRNLQPFVDSLPEHLQPDATVLEMPSMAAALDRLQLVEVKVVGGNYPLIGELTIRDQGVQGQPPGGSVWVEAALLAQLDIAIGETIELGYASLRLAGVIEHEPDRVAGAFSVGPRVILSANDLQATGLVQQGSRFRTRLLYKRPADEVFALQTELDQLLPDGALVENAREGIETTREMTRQATRYLRLTSFAGLLLAMVAIYLSISGLLERRIIPVATLKALGAPNTLVLQSFLLLLLATATSAGLVGIISGTILQSALPVLLGDLLPGDLPRASNRPLWQGLSVALLMTLLAALPPLWRLVKTPPIMVLRSGTPPAGSGAGRFVQLATTAITCGAMLIWLAQDIKLGFQASAALLALLLFFAGCGQLLLLLLLRLIRNSGLVWRQSVIGLVRSRAHTLFALAALSSGILALLAPSLVQQDLLRQWLVKVPAESPNHFLIGIQPDQVAQVTRRLSELGATQFDPQPMIRARLASVDGLTPDQLVLTSRRARRMAERENNLSWRLDPEPHNPILQGRWWPQQPQQTEISVEQEWAELLGVELGSKLVFTVSGAEHEGIVTSIRQVDWERLTTNFFIIFSPGSLASAPTGYVTSYRAEPAAAEQLQRELIGEFPNLTVIDMRQILEAMQSIVNRLAAAVQFMGGLTLLAGCAVLLSVVVAERGRVSQEAALLRALGATNQQVKGIFTLRFGLLGLLASILGVFTALVTGALLASSLLKTAYHPSVSLLLVTLVIGALMVTLVGRAGCRRAISASPLKLLKEGG